jgi:PTH1 family peptidyl-tRNA hydrolase
MDIEKDSSTFLLVGLGNPGREYRGTRHNIGFMLVDRLAARLGVSFTRLESRALVTKGEYQGRRLILAKPQTYMNLSGQAVGSLLRFYQVPLARLLVAYDEVDLPLGTLRLRPSGSSAGHKGIQSIIDRLGSRDFPRLRLGVDRPPGRKSAAVYVTRNFSPAQAELLPEVLDRAVEAVLIFVTDGIAAAMNQYNGPLEREQ